MALTEANCFRGAEVTEQYLRLYAARLEKEDSAYLFPALTNLGERIREDGETTLLSLPMILQEIHILSPRAKTAYEQEVEEMNAERQKAREAVN